MFTAKEARHITEQAYLDSTLGPILDKIREAAHKGQDCVYIYTHINHRLKTELVRAGFTIRNNNEFMNVDDSSYTITW